MRVLVVDDDVVVSIELSLSLPDVQLLEASRADEGYALAVREQPDAVVVDVRLPEGDGIDLVRRLRFTNATRRMPVAVLTAAYDPANEASVLQAGADAYLGKPFDAIALLAHLEGIAAVPPDQRRARRQAAVAALQRGIAPEPLVDLTALETPAGNGHRVHRHRWRWARQGR